MIHHSTPRNNQYSSRNNHRNNTSYCSECEMEPREYESNTDRRSCNNPRPQARYSSKYYFDSDLMTGRTDPGSL